MPLEPISTRSRNWTLTAFVAADTIEAIADRIETLARSGRRMTRVHRYLGSDRTDITVGLTVDTDGDGISRWTQDSPSGRGIHVHIGPGLDGFGVAAYDRDGDEATVAERFRSERPHNAAWVSITGGDAGGGGREDRIEITRFNEHGVGSVTTVAFDLVTSEERSAATARFLETLAGHTDATGELMTPDALRSVAAHLRHHRDTLPAALLGHTRPF